MQGTPQAPVTVEEGDGYSKVVKRVVLKSGSEHSEVGCALPAVAHSSSTQQGSWSLQLSVLILPLSPRTPQLQ